MTETQDPNFKGAEAKKTAESGAKPRLSALEAKRAQNLRDNLQKRKQQARARSEAVKDLD